MTFREKLIELKACGEAVEWVGDKSFNEAWATCERGDRMGWLAEKVGHDKRERVLAAGHCANLVRHLMTDERSTKAVDVAIAYGEGRATDDELEIASAAASDAAASAAAYAAADAAYSAASASAAYAYAAYAAYSAAADAAYSAAYSARREALSKCADIYRQYINKEELAKLLEVAE